MCTLEARDGLRQQCCTPTLRWRWYRRPKQADVCHAQVGTVDGAQAEGVEKKEQSKEEGAASGGQRSGVEGMRERRGLCATRGGGGGGGGGGGSRWTAGCRAESRYLAGEKQGGMGPGPGEMNSGRWAAVCSRPSKRFERQRTRWERQLGGGRGVQAAALQERTASRSSEARATTGELVVRGRQREEGGQRWMCLDASLADVPRTRAAAANQAVWRDDLHWRVRIVSCRWEQSEPSVGRGSRAQKQEQKQTMPCSSKQVVSWVGELGWVGLGVRCVGCCETGWSDVWRGGSSGGRSREYGEKRAARERRATSYWARRCGMARYYIHTALALRGSCISL
ncbi:hypothetical protein DE146DRAFT_627092 [Phaeosphaeria sp. MPI-PUGE-AT-0046c]|nr:hypothetical protein DE146DRAFT_627092 [Phaeosphaeria sp. MPI-PUGE-AT-0046c]